MANLTGQVVIVTGSSRGIGRAISERLGRDGASVVVNYAGSQEKAEEVVRAIEAAGSKAIAVQADMSNPEEVKHLFDETEKQFGQLQGSSRDTCKIVPRNPRMLITDGFH